MAVFVESEGGGGVSKVALERLDVVAVLRDKAAYVWRRSCTIAVRHIRGVYISVAWVQETKEITTMNVNLSRAIFGIGEADAPVFAIEGPYLDLDVKPADLGRQDRGTHAFYALWGIINGVADDLNELQGDELVDNIYAAREVSRRCTLKKDD